MSAASDSAVARLALDFQPDAQEIEQRPPPVTARLTLYVLLALIASAVAWSAISHVDRIVVARGKLVTTASTIVVQPLETSVVRSLEAKIGDIVRAGDTLATLDQTFSEADLEQLRVKLASLAAQIARLEAELDRRPYRVAGGMATADERLQAFLDEKRQAQLVARIEAFDRDVARTRAAIATKTADREALVARLEVARELEAMRMALFQKEIGNKVTLLEARSARMQVERDLQLAANEALELRQQVAKTEADRAAFIEEWRQKAAEELVAARRDHDATEKQLEKAKRRNAMVVLTAPVDAVVLEIAPRSVGSVLKEAEPLYTLVPLDVPLEAEVSIEASDIGSALTGAPAMLKLDAYPFQKHGTLEGRVRTITEDAFSDKEKAREAFYRARVELRSLTLRDVPEEFRLIPGMTVTAEVKAGDRSVLSYFAYPLIRGFSESIREP